MGTANLELKTPSELLDEIVRLRKALELIVKRDRTGFSRRALANIAKEALTNGELQNGNN